MLDLEDGHHGDFRRRMIAAPPPSLFLSLVLQHRWHFKQKAAFEEGSFPSTGFGACRAYIDDSFALECVFVVD